MTQPRTNRLLAVALCAAALAGCGQAPLPPTQTVGATAAGIPVQLSSGVSALPSMPSLTGARLRPDVLVTGRLTPGQVAAVSKVAPSAVTFSHGTVKVVGKAVHVAVVDPESFRRYAPSGTAESTPVWQTVAAGQLVASHSLAKRLRLTLGQGVMIAGNSVRLGALATTGLPDTDLIMSGATARLLRVAAAPAVIVSAGTTDPAAVAGKVRAAAGSKAEIALLTAPTANPTAFLSGSRSARAFGAFSYRYYADGTIEPDARWVRANIATERVPLIGKVTCHRLMLPQLRAALRDVERAGLGSEIHTYNGCYVPRFIERNPARSISLHTWGIAIDLDAATNYRGIRGTMHPRVVQIFKRWGFRWGGDWTYTDPMHFELAALIKT